MTADDAVVALLGALDTAGIPYMIVGSLASNFHGIPRSTRDADFVVELGPSSLDQLSAALPVGIQLGAQGAFEAVTGTTRYLIEMIGMPFVCELFIRSDDAHDQERFKRRKRVEMLGRVAFVASVEDMIVTKLRWGKEAGRAKDRDDVRNMLAVRKADLDWNYISRWTQEHGTSDLLTEIQATLPAAP